MVSFDDEEFDEMLEEIQSWDVLGKGIRELLEYAKSVWAYKDFVEIRGDWYRFVTGGLSDNEEIIAALKTNIMSILYWHSSTSNGEHIFCVSKGGEENPFYQYIKKGEQ